VFTYIVYSHLIAHSTFACGYVEEEPVAYTSEMFESCTLDWALTGHS
jgi:hypothetical protein